MASFTKFSEPYETWSVNRIETSTDMVPLIRPDVACDPIFFVATHIPRIIVAGAR